MSDLDRLMYWRGIAEQYQNYRGENVKVPLENRLTLLEAMSVDVSTAKSVTDAANELDVEPWRHFFPLLQTCRIAHQELATFYVNLHPDRISQQMLWQLKDSQGSVVDSGALFPVDAPEVGDYLYNNARYTRRLITTNLSRVGYYTISIEFIENSSIADKGDINTENMLRVEASLAVAPKMAYQPDWLSEGARPWGFIIQLYTLRTKSDWGIGDFSDLQLLIRKSAALGADVIGLNPVHALLPDVETFNSPYSPSDRRFVSPLYIDPINERDFIRAPELHTETALKTRKSVLASLREKLVVDYAAVKNLKYPVFESMFRYFIQAEQGSGSDRDSAFLAFVDEGGISLLQYALYEVARDHWQGATFCAQIGDEVLTASPNSELFQAALAEHRQSVLFHCYLQWLAQLQLENCQKLAVDNGMRIGLVRDLAVGADGGGAEAFSNPDQFCRSVAVGAPPDPLAEQGQNWGLPPMDPAYLRQSGYSHFIHLLRANMAQCGALRIDHAMSLMRLWWVPPDQTADHGAYVYYPFEDMLAILCLESYLNECAVIGEDLGVVPYEFRQAITEAGVFTNRVFYFEKENYSYFKSPANYDVHALAMVNNHDVPTLTSWWNGTDLILRDKLDIFEEGVDYESMVEQRTRDKHELLNFLRTLDALPESWHSNDVSKPADETLVYALLKAVSHVASRIYVIQLEDVLLMDAPVNVPGTFKEHANWQRKLDRTIEHIFESASAVKMLSAIDSTRRTD